MGVWFQKKLLAITFKSKLRFIWIEKLSENIIIKKKLRKERKNEHRNETKKDKKYQRQGKKNRRTEKGDLQREFKNILSKRKLTNSRGFLSTEIWFNAKNEEKINSEKNISIKFTCTLFRHFLKIFVFRFLFWFFRKVMAISRTPLGSGSNIVNPYPRKTLSCWHVLSVIMTIASAVFSCYLVNFKNLF